MTEVDARKLTKKEKKALAFRAGKGKGKKGADEAQDEVPEQEDLNQAEEDRLPAQQPKDKKRKRDDSDSKDEPTQDAVATEQAPKKKKRQRGGMNKPKVSPGEDAEGKPKLVLFIGNLPFKVTLEQIQTHFTPCGETPVVRLLTPKQSHHSPNPSNQSKGCAFIQFTQPLALQAALRLHESDLGGRKINVELTAGGGGNSEQRKAKIAAKRKSMGEEREKVARNKRVREGKPADPADKSSLWGNLRKPAEAEGEKKGGGAGGGEDDKPKTQKKEIVLPSGQVKKVRDRRIPKTGPDGVEKERARKAQAKAAAASSGANSIKLG
ncbi:hypothetical protein BCR35DRAFT_304887 [Leucosporidium creatinivorum]|uniref:RRM domain-containing protein n=1 Tax=Leucosporidium creatinivorum TaxID=106004 RepID=A0A1Y2F4S8_9BASI|nr:hypothetical protein BCR35DRAFT_304887 [Leucosporidium creatinivorum]